MKHKLFRGKQVSCNRPFALKFIKPCIRIFKYLKEKILVQKKKRCFEIFRNHASISTPLGPVVGSPDPELRPEVGGGRTAAVRQLPIAAQPATVPAHRCDARPGPVAELLAAGGPTPVQQGAPPGDLGECPEPWS